MPGRNEYWGDIRDKFEELHPSSASFVVTDYVPGNDRPYLEIVGNLESSVDSDGFRMVCYFYEDSFDWGKFPLVFLGSSEYSKLRWKLGEQIIIEKDLATIRETFGQATEDYLKILDAAGD